MPANRRVTRYHLEDETDSGITRSKLSKLGRKRQLDYMRAWFGKYYTDPVHEMPWMEGEYHFPYGGPYNAFDELYNEFAGTVPEERIRELAEDIEGEDGTYDWAPTSRHSDYMEAIDDIASIDDGADLPNPPPPDLNDLLFQLRGGARISLGTAEERAERQRFSHRIAILRRAFANRRNRPRGIGDNNPPPNDLEEEQDRSAVSEIEQTTAEIAAELQLPTPNVIEIAEKTSRLRRLGKWLGDRLNKGVDALVGAGVLYGAGQIVTHIDDIQRACAHWIQEVISMF